MRPQPEHTEIPKKRKSLFRPLRKGLPYAGIVLGILLFIFQASVIAYTENVLGQFLLNVVSYETQGRYQIEYSKVKFNIFSKKLTLTGFALRKSPQLSLNPPNSGSLNIDAGLLSLEIESILSFVVNKKLDVVGLEVINPKIQVVQSHESDSVTEQGKVSSKIKNYLNQLTIKRLSIQHGDFSLTRIGADSSTMEVTDATIEVHNLRIVDDDDDLFVADNVEIELLNERHSILKDHDLSFDRLWLSLGDSVVYLNNVNLIPTSTGGNSLAVHYPEISVTGIDLLKLIKENIVDIRSIEIAGGSIIGVLRAFKGSGKWNPAAIPSINLGTLSVLRTDLSVGVMVADTIHQVESRDTDFILKHMRMDSTTSFTQVLSNLDISFSSRNYSINLPHLAHSLKSKKTKLDFQNGELTFDSIRIEPNAGSRNGQLITAPRLSVGGLELLHFMQTGEVFVGEVVLDQPIVRSRLHRSNKAKQDWNPKNLFPLLGNTITLLKVRTFQLNNGQIQVRDSQNRQLVSSDGLSMTLGTIQIDSMMSLQRDQIFGIKGLDISFEQFRYHPTPFQTYSLDDLQFDSDSGYADLGNFSLISRSEIIEHFRVEEISIRKLNWMSLINEKNVYADSMVVQNISVISRVDTTNVFRESPKIPSTPNLPDSVLISFIELKNGQARFQSLNGNISLFNRFSSTIENLNIVKGEQYLGWSSTAFVLNSGPFSTGIMRGTHQLSGRALSLNKKDSVLTVNRLRLVPTSSSIPTRIRAVVPQLQVTGVIPAQLVDSSHLHLDQVILVRPTVRLEIQPAKNQQRITNEPVMDHLEIKSLQIMDGDINSRAQVDGVTHRASLAGWDMNVRNIVYDPSIGADNLIELFGDLSISSKRLSYSGLEQIKQLVVGPLSIHSQSGGEFKNVRMEIASQENTVHAKIPILSYHGNNWLKNLVEKNYSLDSIVISRPDVLYSDMTKLDSVAGAASYTFTDLVMVGAILIRDGNLRYTGKEDQLHFPEVHLEISSLNYQNPASRDFHSENIELNLYNVRDITNSEFNSIDLDHLYLSTQENRLELKGLSVTPRYSKNEYGPAFGKQTDWMTLKNNRISLLGTNFKKYFFDSEIEIDSIEIDSVDMYVFRDKNVPFPEDQVRHMPRTMLNNLGIPLNIDQVRLNHLDVTYEELVPDAFRSGLVDFTNLSATIKNITNDSATIARDSILLVRANAKMLDAADIEIKMEYNLNSIENEHEYVGLIGPMDARKMNKILEPNVNIQVKSGKLDRLNLKVNGNDTYATGDMTMIYNNLHIRAISKKNEEPKGMGPAFVTFFANTFVINRNNPKFLLPRVGEIFAERDTARSIFNYLAKTALSGVVSSIGARSNNKDLKRLNKAAKEVGDKKRERIQRKAGKKEEKQEKKDNRKSEAIENKEEN